MILSSNRELGEFDACREPEHIARVWAAMQERLPRYWSNFVGRQTGKASSPTRSAPSAEGGGPSMDPAVQAFAAAVRKYEKDAGKYRTFFDPEAMEEFADDPGAFKQHLAKEVPVVSGPLNQRRPELLDWQKHFRTARPKDLFEVFANVMDFQKDWAGRQPEPAYAAYDTPDEFGLDPLDTDEAMSLVNVIGMGIKSIALHHLDPRILPQRARLDLYGLYFLSGMDDFGLASGSSEFLMINDHDAAPNGSMIMEHNFWYSYGLFSLYALRIFRWLREQVSDGGSDLDVQVRYVYVSHFLAQVCSEHAEDMRVMRAHDRFEVPG